jgi:hypothetical protein
VSRFPDLNELKRQGPKAWLRCGHSLDSKTGDLSVKAHQVFVTYELAQLFGYLTAATALLLEASAVTVW